LWAEDEKVYGPVDVDTLHQWIQDERLFPQTFVQSQSDSCWRRAEDVEILREKFTATPLAAAAARNGISSTASALREFPFFAGLANEGLEQVAALGKTYDVEAGQLVVRQGDPCDSVYFVLDGELRVRILVGVVDRVDKTLCKLGRGEFFGELGMFLRSKRTADVIAESQTRLFCIYTNAFQLLIKQIPELASPILFSIGTTMAQRVADDNQRLYHEMTSQFVWA
jgi:signal-transduction protein with cAMP-binding, CBS, and nucleotidyltransferase domain